MINTSVPEPSAVRLALLGEAPAFIHPPQLSATGYRSDSSLHPSVICTPQLSHPFISQVICAHLCARAHACPFTSFPLCLYGTLMQTHTLGACSRGEIRQTLIWQFSVSAVRAGWRGCRSRPCDLQAAEAKTGFWCLCHSIRFRVSSAQLL